MILNETVAAIAEAIREKTGKSELIAPIDFASEIKGITAGGGESLEFYYLKMEDFQSLSSVLNEATGGPTILIGIMMYIDEIKISSTRIKSIAGAGMIVEYPMESIKAISIKSNWALSGMESDGTISSVTFNDILAQARIDFPETIAAWDATPKITKEQFYDLNA
jgi:hypothetical protein